MSDPKPMQRPYAIDEAMRAGAAAPTDTPRLRPGMSISTPFGVKFSTKGPEREFMVARTSTLAVMITTMKWVSRKKGAYVPELPPLLSGKWDEERRRIVVTEAGVSERGSKELTDAQIKQVLRAATDALEWEQDAVVNKPPPKEKKPAEPAAEIDY